MTKKIITGIIIPVLVFCLAADIWLFIYYAMGWNKHVSLTTNYVDDMTFTEEEDTQYFMELEYFSNKNNNGIENFSAKLNYYTDTSLPEQNEDGTFAESKYVYSSGIQFKNGFTYDIGADYTSGGKMYDKKGWYYFYTVEPTNCTYYNVDNQANTAFEAVNELKDQNKWVYDIDGQLCLIESAKSESLGSTNFLWSERRVCDINYCLLELYNSVKTLEDGKHILVFDLSRFFSIKMFNAETGKFDIEPTGNIEWTFVRILINKTSDGLVSANQTMFGSYMGEPKWTLYDMDTDQKYWQMDNIYYLNISDFTFEYSNNKNYLKLQTNTLKFLEDFENMQYIVSIDLDNIYLGSELLEIDGFAKGAFGALNIQSITLESDNELIFEVFDNLNIIHSDNITLEVVA